MDDQQNNDMPNPLQLQFLNEPFWKWVVFIIALGLFLHAWRAVLAEFK